MISERTAPKQTPGKYAARFAWLPLAFSVALVACSATLLALNHSVAGASPYWLNMVAAALAFSMVGALIASRRRENLIGWLFLAVGVLYGITAFAGEYGIYAFSTGRFPLPGGAVAFWLASWLWIPSGTLIPFSLLLFPDGRLPSPRWRIVAWFFAFAICLETISSALTPGPLDTFPTAPSAGNPFGVEGAAGLLRAVGAVSTPFMAVGVLGTVASLFLRLRRAQGEERQQLKWVTYAVAVLAVAILSSSFSAALDLSLFGRTLFLIGFLAIPVAVGVAILKYRLYDIDFVINRTLVYGALSACIVGIYVLVVGYLGALFQTEGSLPISLVATGLVAVFFAPLRDRLQRGANRLMYGERDEPYAAVSRLGERLEATLAPEAVLPAIVETVREALKLPYAAIALPRDGAFEVAATSGGEQPAAPLVLPLSYGGETVGRLLLGSRAPGERFSSADRRLLDGLARHAGVAVHGVRAMVDLRRSREELVLAREEERRRLRRDLHDELAPTLAALGLTAATVGELIPANPAKAASTNEKLREAIRITVGDVRRLVYDLRPPALDDLGLVEAIRERASRRSAGDEGFRAKVEAPETLPPLPAAVEVAAYRIAQEALANAARHARASTCFIRIGCPDGRALTVEVTDDGVGLPERPQPGGVGLSSMRERAAELGGTCEVTPAPPSGTRVFARLPLGEPPLQEQKE